MFKTDIFFISLYHPWGVSNEFRAVLVLNFVRAFFNFRTRRRSFCIILTLKLELPTFTMPFKTLPISIYTHTHIHTHIYMYKGIYFKTIQLINNIYVSKIFAYIMFFFDRRSTEKNLHGGFK